MQSWDIVIKQRVSHIEAETLDEALAAFYTHINHFIHVEFKRYYEPNLFSSEEDMANPFFE